MAVDFSVLGGPTLPMRAKEFAPVDAVGNTETAYTLAGTMVDTRRKMQAEQRLNKDRQALEQAQQAGKLRMGSPEEIDAALGFLQDKVSPETFLDMQSKGLKQKTDLLALQDRVSKLPERELDLLAKQEDLLMPYFNSLTEVYDSVKTSKGEQAAEEAFTSGRTALMSQLGSAKLPGGEPLFNANVLQNYAAMTPDQLRSVIEGSKYRKDLIGSRLNAARAARETAQAAALAGGAQDFVQYTDPRNNTYFYSRRLNQTVQVLPDGTRTPIAALPPDAMQVGAAATARVLATGSAAEEVPALTPEENERLAEFTRVSGKPIPVPSFGTGAAARQDRVRFLRNFLADMSKRGETPTQAGVQAATAVASREALKRITTQDTILSTGERELVNILDKMEAELQRIGGPDSPLVRRYWNRAVTEILGEPTFSGFNALYTGFIDEAARVTSGATGAGGTPVAYKQLAERMMSPDVNLSQLLAFKQPFNDLISARKRAVEASKQELIRSSTPPPRQGAAAPAPAPAPAVDEVRTRVEAAGLPYEPNLYDYRVAPDGSIQRRRKPQ
jgi:hypothetical protein